MMMKSLMRNLFSTGLLVASVSASATTDTYGDLLSGTFQPDSTFASMTYTNIDNVYSFTLSAFDLDAIFNTGSFIGSIAVDAQSMPTISNVVGDTVVSVANGSGPSGVFDFRFDLTGPNKTRLTANESVSWDATFSEFVSLDANSFSLHVQGLSQEQGGSAWYTASPVPEPETYAMMLVGLGLLGFTAKRKNAH
jgi:hypothetical protein